MVLEVVLTAFFAVRLALEEGNLNLLSHAFTNFHLAQSGGGGQVRTY